MSWLFVSGEQPDRFCKAAQSGADEIIVDLEDAVGPNAKGSARAAVVDWLASGHAAWVRINAAGTPWHDQDLVALAACEGLRGVVVPKADREDVINGIAERLGPSIGVVALVETAAGLRDIASVAGSSVVRRLAFGSFDFALDIDAAHTREALLYARSTLVTASRAAGLPPPVDGVTSDLRNLTLVLEDAQHARSLGFGGKLCVHPLQVAPVNSAFAPTPAEIEWASKVLASGRDGACSVDGQMVDRPILRRARRILGQCDSQ